MNNRQLLLLFSIIVFSILTYSWTPGNPTVDWSKAGTSAMELPRGDWFTVHNWSELSNALSARDRSTLTQITIDTINAIYITTPTVLDSNVIITGYGPKSRLLFRVS